MRHDRPYPFDISEMLISHMLKLKDVLHMFGEVFRSRHSHMAYPQSIH